jgi:hypothetical protein
MEKIPNGRYTKKAELTGVSSAVLRDKFGRPGQLTFSVSQANAQHHTIQNFYKQLCSFHKRWPQISLKGEQCGNERNFNMYGKWDNNL